MWFGVLSMHIIIIAMVIGIKSDITTLSPLTQSHRMFMDVIYTTSG